MKLVFLKIIQFFRQFFSQSAKSMGNAQIKWKFQIWNIIVAVIVKNSWRWQYLFFLIYIFLKNFFVALSLQCLIFQTFCAISCTRSVTVYKVSVFGVFLVRIFPHSDWIQRYSLNAVKYGPEKLRIRTFFTQREMKHLKTTVRNFVILHFHFLYTHKWSD